MVVYDLNPAVWVGMAELSAYGTLEGASRVAAHATFVGVLSA